MTTETVETKLVEMLDALQTGAVQVGEKIIQYSPDIANSALWVVRIDGAQNLLSGVICCGILWICWKIGHRLWKLSKDKPDHAAVFFGPIGIASVSTVAAIGSFELLCLWNWIAIFEPKLWLAKQIITATLGK